MLAGDTEPSRTREWLDQIHAHERCVHARYSSDATQRTRIIQGARAAVLPCMRGAQFRVCVGARARMMLVLDDAWLGGASVSTPV